MCVLNASWPQSLLCLFFGLAFLLYVLGSDVGVFLVQVVSLGISSTTIGVRGVTLLVRLLICIRIPARRAREIQ